jgi:hypothetical protein
MGSIVLQVNGTTVGNVADGAGVQIIRSVSDVDSGRLITALGEYYAGRFTVRPRPDGGSEPVLEKTVENIIRVWWEDTIRQAMKHVERHEAKQLTPTPISVVEG